MGKPFWNDLKVRVSSDDDDWPNRVGRAQPAFNNNPGWVWVQFEDGEGGEYPADSLTLVDER